MIIMKNTSTWLMLMISFFMMFSTALSPMLAFAKNDVRSWEGDWLNNTLYISGDSVQNNGSSYVCVNAHNSAMDNQPPDGRFWIFVSPEGVIGDRGPTGLPGGLGSFPGSSLNQRLVTNFNDGFGFVFGDSNIWVDGGIIGVGTPMPTTPLTVNGIMTGDSFVGDGSGLNMTGYDSGGRANINDMIVGADSDNSGGGDINLQTRATTRMVVINSGPIGIGTGSPSTALDTNGTINAGGFIGNGVAIGTSQNSYWSYWNGIAGKQCSVSYMDTVLEGNFCVGLDCNPGQNFGDDAVILKENNLRILFLDTSSFPFPGNDWRVTGNDSVNGGRSYLAIHDESGDTLPLLIEAGAPENSLFVKKTSGNVGIGNPAPLGKLDVAGPIYQRSNRLHADYVFSREFLMESITEHADFMWQQHHLKGVPPQSRQENGDEVTNTGDLRRGILEELEKAHIYIEQLDQKNKQLRQRIEKMEIAAMKLLSQ
jgi:hypothetical protein